MIYCDIDGVLIDFYGTAKKFGVELKVNEFGKWSWDKVPPEEFYAKAELQPWAVELLNCLCNEDCAEEAVTLLTKDYKEIKKNCLNKLQDKWHFVTKPLEDYYGGVMIKDTSDKSLHCLHPWDTLIDDNLENILAWRRKGGVVFWFNMEWENPYEKFLEWARLK